MWKGIDYSNSLTQHGGLSGIILKRRDPIVDLLLDNVWDALGKDISKKKGSSEERSKLLR